MAYKPHHWYYDQLNGFWAHCSCGYSSSSISDYLLRRRMNRHVRESAELALIAAQILAISTNKDDEQ